MRCNPEQSPNGYRAQRGLTMMEIVVVIGLAALLITLALPLYTGLLRDRKVARVADDLSGVMRFTQQAAIGNSVDACGYRVVVSATSAEVFLVASTGTPGVCAFPESLTLVRRTDPFPSDVSVAATTVQFTNAGRLTASGNVDITVTAGDRTRTVRIHYLTGRVEVAQ